MYTYVHNSVPCYIFERGHYAVEVTLLPDAANILSAKEKLGMVEPHNEKLATLLRLGNVSLTCLRGQTESLKFEKCNTYLHVRIHAVAVL